MKRSLTVKVAGQTLTIKTDADTEYVESLARFVNEKIHEAKKRTKTVATQRLVLLTALNIADDLFRANHRQRDLRQKVQATSKRILELIDRAEGAPDRGTAVPDRDKSTPIDNETKL